MQKSLHVSLTHPARGSALHRLGHALDAVAAYVAEARRARRTIRALHHLDDRVLRDIGVARGDIEDVVLGRKPRRPGCAGH